MNFTAALFALIAAAQNIAAFPFSSLDPSDTQLAPVLVTKLTCDSNTFKCTANLDYGEGQWVAQWNTAVFHTGLFGVPDDRAANDITGTSQCTANLDFGDGKWVAQWSADVSHQSFTYGKNSVAPVPVTKLTCDGSSFKCNANLDFGDGRWVAQWATAVFHNGLTTAGFLQQ